MHCFGCGYELRGLPAGACPECGRAFNPSDPQTFGDAPPRWNPARVIVVWSQRAFYVAVASPWMVFVFSNLALILARLERGHWPNRMGGQPPEHSPLANAATVVAGFFMVILLMSPFLILALPWCMSEPQRKSLWRRA